MQMLELADIEEERKRIFDEMLYGNPNPLTIARNDTSLNNSYNNKKSLIMKDGKLNSNYLQPLSNFRNNALYGLDSKLKPNLDTQLAGIPAKGGKNVYIISNLQINVSPNYSQNPLQNSNQRSLESSIYNTNMGNMPRGPSSYMQQFGNKGGPYGENGTARYGYKSRGKAIGYGSIGKGYSGGKSYGKGGSGKGGGKGGK